MTFIYYLGLEPLASKTGQSAKKNQTGPSKPLVKKYISSDVLKKPVKITPQEWSINADIKPEDVADPTSVAATVAKWKKEVVQNKSKEEKLTLFNQQDCQPRWVNI